MANYPSNLNVFREEKEMLPEQRLWRAVLLQAIEDAFGNNQSQVSPLERQVARDWMKDFNLDFANVCENAGFNPKQAFYKFKKYSLTQKGIINER
jgi:hypothetical protein